jgi:hypothetical protein
LKKNSDHGVKNFFNVLFILVLIKKTMKSYLFAALLLCAVIAQAQTTKPKIGSDKGIKEAFIRIKAGLPDIKKNLAVKDKRSGNYRPKFSIGGESSYREDDNQHLTFIYSSSNYSGTLEDYQNYYKTLVSITKEVFGANYTATSSERGNVWRTGFYENGENAYTSTTSIYIKCDETFESSPSITIEITSQRK